MQTQADSRPNDRLDELAAEWWEQYDAAPASGADQQDLEPAHGIGHGGGGEARAFNYRGHEVRIVTHYEVTIDGEPWKQHVEVHFDGTVSYHGLPQYVVPSAVELIGAVIDNSYEAPTGIREAIALTEPGR